MNEAETRAELIDPALRSAGWGVDDGSRVRREVIAPGRLIRDRALLCVAAFAALASFAATAGEPVVISRELCNGLWVVPLTWASDESGGSHGLTALFDTGGSNLYIDPDGLERVSGQRIELGRRVRMKGVSAATLKFSKFRPRVREMSHLGAALGREFDVLLPFRAFAGKLLVLDYPEREMRIQAGSLPVPDGEIDGTPVAERGCAKLDEPDKLRQRLAVQRGDDIEQFDLEFIDLIE